MNQKDFEEQNKYYLQACPLSTRYVLTNNKQITTQNEAWISKDESARAYKYSGEDSAEVDRTTLDKKLPNYLRWHNLKKNFARV